MKPERLAEIEARLARRLRGVPGSALAAIELERGREAFLAHAPTDLADLCAEVRRLRAALEKVASQATRDAFVMFGAGALVRVRSLAERALKGEP